MNWRFIDWIWHIRGRVPLPAGQSAEEAFDRLDPLFRERDTVHNRAHDTLTFSKSNQAPQDKMAVYDGGVLRIERSATGPVLRYDLTSRMLLFCFLAPFLFLAFGQLNVVIGELDKPTAEEKAEAKRKKEEREAKEAARQLHPIDKFLGAPEPEKPEKDEEGKDEEEDEEGPSPTAAYVFAAIFAVLYASGRTLEAWLIGNLFRRRLSEERSPEVGRPFAR